MAWSAAYGVHWAVVFPMSSPPAQSLADVLRQRGDHVVSRFVLEVQRKDLPPDGVSKSMLVDAIPAFIADIADALERSDARASHPDSVVSTNPNAREHGEQRWSLGYDLEALIREYAVLRRSILAVGKDFGVSPTPDEFEILSKCLDVAVAEAATEYSRHRDRELGLQKERVEFLGKAAQLLSSSLDYRFTLSRLTGLVVPRMADWCAVFLDGVPVDQIPLAHEDPSKLPLLRELFVRFPPASADSRIGEVQPLRKGEPVLFAEITPELYERVARSPEHLELMRQLGTCSSILVPLRVQEHTFGALMLSYSHSKRHYDADDLALAGDLAWRAAAAIDNARLYEFSQRERSRVEAATRAKDEFVAMVSHELRTPLNAILGWLRLMRGGALDAERHDYALDVIHRNAQAQAQLVDDLLDISRVITGRLRITPSQFDLANVVAMAIESVRPAAEAKRIEIDVDVDGEEAVLRGDAERLYQVAWNLLANAVKFTPKNGHVRVSLRRVESDIELVVSDDGEGIEPSFLPHVFEIFRQSDSSPTRRHGGLGIGLSIVKHIVDLHGGHVWANSAGKGTGATFSVRLPISPLVSTTLGVSRVPATSLRPPEPPLPTGLAGIRVLVVDDDPDALELLVAVLETCGMDVRTASTVREALDVLTTYAPTVICSDLGLRDEDGFAFIRRLRSDPDPAKQAIPAIALTAAVRDEDRARALVDGFNLHMAKPVEPSALVHAILELAGSSAPASVAPARE